MATKEVQIKSMHAVEHCHKLNDAGVNPSQPDPQGCLWFEVTDDIAGAFETDDGNTVKVVFADDGSAIELSGAEILHVENNAVEAM